MEDVPYGRILREGWLIIVIGVLIGAAAAFGITKVLPKTYASSSTLMLQVSTPNASLFERNQFSLARIKTYPALVGSPAVIKGVREDVGLAESAYSDRDIRAMLTAQNTSDTVLLVVSAEAPTAKMASEVANAAAEHLSALVEATENSAADQTKAAVSMTQVLPAPVPASPASPQTTAIVGLGAVVGLALGGILAVVRTTSRRRLITVADVRRSSGLPVVGMLTRRADALGDAAAATIGNLVALGGANRRVYALVVGPEDARDAAELDALVSAGADVGRDVAVLDLRSGTQFGASTRSLTDVFGSPAEAGAVYAAGPGLTQRQIERAAPALATTLARDHDLVFVVVDTRASGLQVALSGAGAAVLPTVRRSGTPAGELAGFVSRLRAMGIRPLGVVMLHAARNDVDTMARSWRASDAVAYTGAAFTPTRAEIAAIAAEIAGAEGRPVGVTKSGEVEVLSAKPAVRASAAVVAAEPVERGSAPVERDTPAATAIGIADTDTEAGADTDTEAGTATKVGTDTEAGSGTEADADRVTRDGDADDAGVDDSDAALADGDVLRPSPPRAPAEFFDRGQAALETIADGEASDADADAASAEDASGQDVDAVTPDADGGSPEVPSDDDVADDRARAADPGGAISDARHA